MRIPLLALCCAALLTTGCQQTSAPESAASSAPDKSQAEVATVLIDHDEQSYAEPRKVAITHIDLDLSIDFDSHVFAGTAIYTLDWKDSGARELVLDSRDITIQSAEAKHGDDWQPLTFDLAKADPVFGSKLTIQAPEQPETIRIAYKTSPEASGLQWMTPEMTQGGRLPFMYSQSQQIHARSWVPLQDTPQVRYTYTAKVNTRPDVMVLMSADNDPQAQRNGSYSFSMPQPIPSYLMAIAAGDLVFEAISDRSGVWAEPEMLETAVNEFADTERMIAVAEKLYGPYRWERYDLLILPPSFPYGGMENPRLSFITPTSIVGDKSLVSLIAHELAHSWSGNLVTMSSAKHGWLNEGMTSYVENRIVEELYGEEFANMESLIARDALLRNIGDMHPGEQVLGVRPGVRLNPGDPTTDVAYDKGAWFLQFLEYAYGRDAFDDFLRGYFDEFAFQVMDTGRFADYFQKRMIDTHSAVLSREALEEWLYDTGIPENAPKIRSARLSRVDTARRNWEETGDLPSRELTNEWSSQEWIHFLEGMPEKLDIEKLTQLDHAYGFSGTANGEIAERWYPLAVRSNYERAYPKMEEFLQTVGRRKLIMPTYEELVKTEAGREIAQAVLERSRAGYHPITTASVERVLSRGKTGMSF